MSLLIAFLILLGSIPVGYLLKYLTKEEISPGRKYFQAVWVVSLVIAIGFLFFPISDVLYKQSIIFTLLFMANVAFISWK